MHSPDNPDPTVTTDPPGQCKCRLGRYLLISLLLHALAGLWLLGGRTGTGRPATVQYIDLTAVPLTAPSAVPSPAPATPPAPPAPTAPSPAQEPPTQPAPVPSPASIGNSGVLSSPLGQALANGSFRSLGEGKTLREDMRQYYFELLEKINQAWWQKAGTLGEVAQQDGLVDVIIERDGTLQRAVMARSTGSQQVDQAILESLSAASPLPPLPGSYVQERFQAPLRFTAPSTLFGFKEQLPAMQGHSATPR